VVRGFGPQTISSVTIERQGAGPALDVSMAHTSAAHVKPGWEDWMVSAAFARRLVANGVHPTVRLIESDSDDQIYPRHERNPSPKLASPTNARSVLNRFRRAALGSGAEVVEASAGRPYGTAPSVTLRVANPAGFLKNKLWHLLEAYNRDRNSYEGYYLGIVDGGGRDVLETGTSTRVQGGSYWVRPDLDSCSPIQHGGTPFGRQPPPCPA
jgi:hypothetical protein